MTYYSRRSNCVSWMITGRSKFPVRQQQKRHDSADKAYFDFSHWREKYFKLAFRERTKSPEEEIDHAIEETDRLTLLRDAMKEVNKLMKKEQKEEAFGLRSFDWNLTR